jgi:hypothetical protein
VQDGLHKNYLSSFSLDSSRIKLVARDIYLLGVCDVKFSSLQAMAAKLKILKLQTSAQRQKSRPIEYHLFFILHTRIFHANFSPRTISLQIISRQVLSRPPHPFFLPIIFSLISAIRNHPWCG